MDLSLYSYLTFDGKMADMPKITISERSTDLRIAFNVEKKRLDRIAGEYYGAGNEIYYRFILMANPQYYLEFDIPKNTILRIPYPLKEVRDEVVSKILYLKDK